MIEVSRNPATGKVQLTKRDEYIGSISITYIQLNYDEAWQLARDLLEITDRI